jgi:tetratricopeptide (TPR) repeat protein
VAAKRNRWLIGSVLFLAVGALLALSFIPFLGGLGSRNATPGGAGSSPATVDPRAELEGRANGYKLVLEREPDNQTALKGLVEARIALGDVQGVVEPLERLAKLNPDITEYSILLAQTKTKLNNFEGAAQVYRSVLTSHPGDMKALEGLVALLINQQRPQAAIGLLQDTLKSANQANEIDPGSIDVISVKLLLGQVYGEQKRYPDAIATYDQAIKDAQTLNASQPDFRPTLAKALVLREMGKESEAKPLFESALALAPLQYKDAISQLVNPPQNPAGSVPGTTSAPGTSSGASPTPSNTTGAGSSSSAPETKPAPTSP